jgi:hypothetical protein
MQGGRYQLRNLPNEMRLLTISNDGIAPVEQRSKGIGSKMLDDLAPRWSLTNTGGITTLKARVPSSALH